ncbi:MAG: hypothetical protein Q4B60_06310 [Erysipelotrichaceae bacterium]|nr:hypothetical protein [Erysipelotrichaceae bacterium]
MASTVKKIQRKVKLNSMTNEELDTNIKEAYKEEAKLKKEILSKEKEAKDILKSKNERVKAITSKHKTDLKEAKEKKAQLDEEIKNLELEKENKRTKADKQIATIEKKEAAIKKAHQKIIKDELDDITAKNNESKELYNKKLENLRQIMQTQSEKYNESMKKLEDNFKEDKANLENKKEELEKTKEELSAKNSESLKKLEEEKENTIKENALSEEERLAKEAAEKEEQIRQTALLGEKRAELNSLYLKLDELNERKEALARENEVEKKRYDEIVADLISKFDKEREYYLQINESLKSDLALRKEGFDKEEKERQLKYKEALSQIDELMSLYGNAQTATFENINKILTDRSEEYQNKYSAFVDYLDKEYQHSVSLQKKEIEDLNHRLQVEEEQLKNRNSYLEERYQNRKAEYMKITEALALENHNLEVKITELDKEYREKALVLKEEIKNIKNAHLNALEKKETEFKKQLEAIKSEKDLENRKIIEKKNEVNAAIAGINIDIEDLNNDLKAYIKDTEYKKESILSRNNEIINGLKNKIEKFKEEITNIDNRNVQSNESFKEKLAALEVEKADLLKEHQSKLSALDEQLSIKLEELKKSHQDSLERAKQVHEEKLLEADKNKEESLNFINEQLNREKVSFEEQKSLIQKQSDEFVESKKALIEKLKQQKDTLLEHITSLKNDLDKEKEDFDLNKNELERIHSEELNKLENDYQERFKEAMTYDPSFDDEFKTAKLAHENKLLEIENLNTSIESRKAEIESGIAKFSEECEERKTTAEAELKAANEKLDLKKEEYEKLLKGLNEAYVTKSSEVKLYKESLDEELKDLEANGEKEIESLIERQNTYYSEVEKAYGEKENTMKEICQREVEDKRKELETAIADYGIAIKEAKHRKETYEHNYNNLYETELNNTKTIQEQYDTLKTELEKKRAEYKQNLEAKKSSFEAELTKINETHDAIVAEKKTQLNNQVVELRNKTLVLKNELLKLESDAKAKQNEFEQYRLDKYNELEVYKRAANAYIKDINKRLADIANKDKELDEVHQNRVNDIKASIKQSVEDYDELVKIKPFTIKEEKERQTAVLTDLANEFKQKLLTLENRHNDIVLELRHNKEVIINNLKNDFADVLNRRENIETTYERDILDLTGAYEKLITEEKMKQAALEESMRDENSNTELIYQSYLKMGEEARLSFEEEKERSENELQERIKLAQSPFFAEMVAISEHINSLQNEKNSVLSRVAELRKEYIDTDQDLVVKRNELLNIFRKKLDEVNEYYDKAIKENKEKAARVDVLGNDIADIFKKK